MGGSDVFVRPYPNCLFCSLPHQVLDLKLTGKPDGSTAHYKLLQSGSLQGFRETHRLPRELKGANAW